MPRDDRNRDRGKHMAITRIALLDLIEKCGLSLRKVLPIIVWGSTYTRATLGADLLAALIVTIMLIPQSLAYALLAGLPAEVGLYASILPLIAYALFGSSKVLAVGPVAVISLMTASAVGKVAETGSADYLVAAIALALLSGLMLIAMGLLRLGLIANFLSHSVISGFMTASGILIAASQFKHILGIKAEGDTLLQLLGALKTGLPATNVYALAIGVTATAFLFWSRTRLKPLLKARDLSPTLADVITKAAPVAAVALTTALAWMFMWSETRGLKVVGDIPRGLPPFQLPDIDLELWKQLATPALLLSVIGFVESVSVAQTLAAKRRHRIVPDQELIGLGAANIASSLSGGYPVTGGFARSVVNFDAGAETPAAGIFTAVGLLFAALLLTPLLYHLPQATLAATIIVAVLSLVDLGALRRTWTYSRIDFSAMAGTIVLTLAAGVELGIATGVALSILLHLWRTSRPHTAIVGLVPGTQHFRNVERHAVQTWPDIVTLRVDESLYFPNARFLEEHVVDLVASRPDVRHVILMCPAVNHIDASALESLEAINRNLRAGGITFHLSEIKGPVMDRLKRSHFLQDLTGQVFLSQFDAVSTLAPTHPTGRPSC